MFKAFYSFTFDDYGLESQKRNIGPNLDPKIDELKTSMEPTSSGLLTKKKNLKSNSQIIRPVDSALTDHGRERRPIQKHDTLSTEWPFVSIQK